MTETGFLDFAPLTGFVFLVTGVRAARFRCPRCGAWFQQGGLQWGFNQSCRECGLRVGTPSKAAASALR